MCRQGRFRSRCHAPLYFRAKANGQDVMHLFLRLFSGEGQRPSASQRRVAPQALPWNLRNVPRFQRRTATRFRIGFLDGRTFCRPAAEPFQASHFLAVRAFNSRVAASPQPFAMMRKPFGLELDDSTVSNAPPSSCSVRQPGLLEQQHPYFRKHGIMSLAQAIANPAGRISNSFSNTTRRHFS